MMVVGGGEGGREGGREEVDEIVYVQCVTSFAVKWKTK
jgi:hypothetical protein